MKFNVNKILNQKFLLFAVLAGALALRLIRYHIDPVISRDACLYIDAAEQWNYGSIPSVLIHSPFFIWILKKLISNFTCVQDVAVFIGIILSVLTVLLVFITFFNFSQNNKTALLGAFLCAFNPYLIRTSIEIQRETIFFFFFWVSLFFLGLLQHSFRSTLKVFLCGLGSALGAYCAFLLRSEGALYICGVVAVPTIIFFEKRDAIRSPIFFFCCFIAGLLAGTAVVVILLHYCGLDFKYQIQSPLLFASRCFYYLK